MSCFTDTETRFLARPRPPQWCDAKGTVWVVAMLVALSISVDLVRALLLH